MDRISLHDATGTHIVDRALRSLIGVFEAAFPARIRAYYVYGSHADASSVRGSDVDVTILFRDAWNGEEEHEQAGDLGESCRRESALDLDLELLDEASLDEGVFPDLKLASRLLYGVDTRNVMRLLPIEQWTRNRMHSAYYLMNMLFNRPGVVRCPIGYPDPTGPFYGYDSRTVLLADGTKARSTRDLIRVTGWAATALVALHARVYVARKRDSHTQYRANIGDHWADLLRDIYTLCRNDWDYLIPHDAAGRMRLRAIGEQVLGFENHFLISYKDFLLAELRSTSTMHLGSALEVLTRVPFRDPAIRSAFRHLHDHNDSTVRNAAEKCLNRLADVEC